MTMSPTRRDGATDLAGICARHGIMTVFHGEWSAVHHDATGCAYVEYGPTEADAVCALLKARYRIGTGTPCRTSGPVWVAAWWERGNPQTAKSEVADTELEAIAALADRLTGGA